MQAVTGRRRRNDSLTTQVATRYRQMILAGRLKPGDRLPTIRWLARELSVSPGPVNEAFCLLESEGLVYRRTRLGTFVGRATRPLPASLEISVIFRPVTTWAEDDNYGLDMFRGIQHGLTMGKHRTVLDTGIDPAHLTEAVVSAAVDHALGHASHGYIVDELMPNTAIERLAASGRPVVVVNRRCDAGGISAVVRDNAQAAVEAARQILRRGHRVTACINRADWTGRGAKSGLWGAEWNSRQATEAFLKEMSEAGFPLPPDRVATYDDAVDVRVMVMRLVNATPRPTAIYCTDDRLAKMAYGNLEGSGLAVGREVSVVGMLDLGMAKRQNPPLTTVRFDPERLGRAAVEEVAARCRAPKRPARVVAIPGDWVERDSLASVPG